MSGEDDREREERPRLSWKEIDRRRDKSGGGSDERRPRGRAAEARAHSATRAYLSQLDEKLFAKDKGGSEGERLGRTVRDAVGTPELANACRAYLERVGPPEDPALLAAFLDAGAREVVLAAVHVLLEALPAGRIRLTPGLRAQLQSLAEGLDDEVAERAEQVLEPG